MDSSIDLCQVPAMPAPNGGQSNFDNPTTLGPTLIAVITLMVLWGIVFTGARLYMNFRKLDWADHFNLIALLISIAILGIEAGLGIAVAIYYETPRSGEPWAAILDGRTLIPIKWWQAQSALSVVLDLYIFLLPLPILVKLQLPLQQRVSLVAVFSLALLSKSKPYDSEALWNQSDDLHQHQVPKASSLNGGSNIALTDRTHDGFNYNQNYSSTYGVGKERDQDFVRTTDGAPSGGIYKTLSVDQEVKTMSSQGSRR
ncbi:hypothetical protein G7054_g10534 [Neopestalotiopsis clavispora]|nr:hypothetical protein G7054_g10534 [Neopestalotiopsis clavispora]